MNKLILASLLGVTVLVFASTANAYKGDPSIQGPNYSPERHEAMQTVFANSDYQGWLKLTEGKAMGLKRVVNSEAKFKEFAQAHEAGTEAMAKFRESNGLTGQGNRSGYGRSNR